MTRRRGCAAGGGASPAAGEEAVDASAAPSFEVPPSMRGAGRAGRAGYDTAGTVVVIAPEHEIENTSAVAKAGDDPKKQKKIVRKKAPQGFVNWGEASFERLVAAEPEPLEPHLQLTAAMLINVIARGGDVFANVRSLVFDNH